MDSTLNNFHKGNICYPSYPCPPCFFFFNLPQCLSSSVKLPARLLDGLSTTAGVVFFWFFLNRRVHQQPKNKLCRVSVKSHFARCERSADRSKNAQVSPSVFLFRSVLSIFCTEVSALKFTAGLKQLRFTSDVLP